MIISASRRTDIPAYYSEWLINRIREGFALVRNPINPRQVSRVNLSPDVVDGIVFWTKNPIPMLKMLDALNDYAYYFQFTLNPYGTKVEPNVPSKNHALIPAFKQLSDILGPGRVIWRYDPVILDSFHTVEYHLKYFEAMAKRLQGFAEKCTFSFLDIYRNTLKNASALDIHDISMAEMRRIARGFSEIARTYGITLETCAEAIDLNEFGIGRARCVDARIFEKLTGRAFNAAKDKNQRRECGCAASVDIGAYQSCMHGCVYCYANRNPLLPAVNHALHDPLSPLLIGSISGDDIITVRGQHPDETRCQS